MKAFTVRVNVEYSTTVNAEDADAAVAMVQDVDVADWDQAAWPDMAAEEE